MTENIKYQKLSDDDIQVLQAQGCSALNWDQIEVEVGFRPARVRNTHFVGSVKIGRLEGTIAGDTGVEKISGIFNAYISNCTIGRNVRIANIGEHIANYKIGNGVCIENVGRMVTTPGAVFGNGVEVEVLNEGGGREVLLFNELSVQFAYIMCLHRYRPKLIGKLHQMALEYAEKVKSDQGKIGDGTYICSTTEITNVNVGAHARIDGAASLTNGTILSSAEAPTTVGVNVSACDFIIAESAVVNDGAILNKTFVGQGCQMGKQFSAENSLFFANSEAFHGEACSVFAGPYTVTHHKSTLLIAGLFSFYNAGSGTNQSNHMYKLGPVHEGRLGRGTKTGSFSYMMWPCCVGPFGVVLGKNTSTFNTSDYPFSHHEARSDGKCLMVPGLNLITVGTVRDGAKWPARDRRKGNNKRDIISFDVFSPYTVEKMIKGSANLKRLYEATPKNVPEVSVGGAMVKRPILRTGQKFYRTGIGMYLLGKVFNRAEQAMDGGLQKVREFFSDNANGIYSQQWIDLGGQLMARQRLTDFEEAVENGEIANVVGFSDGLEKIQAAYNDDEWVWVKNAYQKVFDTDLNNISKDDLLQIAESFLKIRRKFLKLVIADAEKEFGELSRTGFGQDGSDDDVASDFSEVRGICEQNKFIREMHDVLKDIEQRIECFNNKVNGM
jgi:Domain of unknown function (DUF4954)/Domain of unknown function (DUF6819)